MSLSFTPIHTVAEHYKGIEPMEREGDARPEARWEPLEGSPGVDPRDQGPDGPRIDLPGIKERRLRDLQEAEAQRFREFDRWFGRLRFAGMIAFLLAFALADPGPAFGTGRWVALTLAALLYGAVWGIVMPRAKANVQVAVGAAHLVVDVALITAASIAGGLPASTWTALWTLLAGQYVFRFGRRGAYAVGALLVVSTLLQRLVAFPWTTELLPVRPEAWAALQNTVPFASLALLLVFLMRMVEQDESIRHRLGFAAIRDSLTGLYNKRHFDYVLAREIQWAKASGGCLGLVMIDLDRFKQINDTYGHQAGDEVLQEVAAVIASSIRVKDSAFRFGGEEFAVILPGASPIAVKRVAHRLRDAIGSRSYSYGQVTASIGWSYFPDQAGTAKELVYKADAAMYDAKALGGNQVVGPYVPVAERAPLN